MKNDNFSTYRQIRKPMPPSERVIPNDKDVKKKEKWDWRRELEDIEEDDDNQ